MVFFISLITGYCLLIAEFMLSFRAKIAFYLEDVTTAIGLTVNLLIAILGAMRYNGKQIDK